MSIRCRITNGTAMLGGVWWALLLLCCVTKAFAQDFASSSRLPADDPSELPPGVSSSDFPSPSQQPFPGGEALPPTDGDSWITPSATGPDGDFWYQVGGKARSFFITDQRIEWSGQETTFAVEGVLAGSLHQRYGNWEMSLDSEFFLTQPYDRNILRGGTERASFVNNFDLDPFQISQLNATARRGDLFFAMGRFVTPFGRFYFPNYLNSFGDSPFIRAESILFRETGLLAQWDPEGYVFTAAVTNGGFQRDANASKAFIGRAGIDRENFALGASVKLQDGIGSENQKQVVRHVGLDGMLRRGAWTLSGEVIYDEYGFKRPGYNVLDIFWGRSLYFRDLSNPAGGPLHGVGYYVNLGYEGATWSTWLSYGDFLPDPIGDIRHDTPNHRGLAKISYHPIPHWEFYSVILAENRAPFTTDEGRPFRYGWEVMTGVQFSL